MSDVVVSDPQILTEPAECKPKRDTRRWAAARIIRAREAAVRLAEWQASDDPPVFCKCCRNWRDKLHFAAYKQDGKLYRQKRCNKCRARLYARSAGCNEKKAFIDQLRAQPCNDCGHTFPLDVMKLWCIDGRPKFSLTQAWSGRGLTKIKEEATRYIVVCSNCFIQRTPQTNTGKHPRRSKLATLPPDLRALTDLEANLVAKPSEINES